jgi:hypothetical protein
MITKRNLIECPHNCFMKKRPPNPGQNAMHFYLAILTTQRLEFISGEGLINPAAPIY